MPDTDISSADIGNFEGTIEDYSVDPQTTDGAQDQKETFWDNTRWTQQLGYYKTIPELKSAIDAKSRWTIGKGFTASDFTTLILDGITGFGKDTFNSILENQDRVMEIAGDSFAEIIRKDGEMINLKPLDPGNMRIVANKKGIIIRYEQLNKSRKPSHKFKPEDIFHLSRDRVADEIHGVSVVDAVEETILTINEATADYKKLLHRNVYPVKWMEIDTDDSTKVAEYKAKADKAFTQGENLIVPKGSTMKPEIIGTPPNATLNPTPWINSQTQKFYQIVGTPQIIVGGAQEITEASAKIVYLAWEQTVEQRQLYIEEQVSAQLNFEINLEFPASLQNEMLSGKKKEETMQASTPEDTSVQGTELGGVQ